MRTLGSVVKIPGSPGFYCRWRGKAAGGKEIKKYGGESKQAAGRKLAKVSGLVLLHEMSLLDAIRQVFSGSPLTRPDLDAMSYTKLADKYVPQQIAERRMKPRTAAKMVEYVEIVKRAPWACKRAEDITDDDAMSWVNGMREKGLASSTIPNRVSQASAIFKWGKRNKWVRKSAANPFLECRIENRRKKDRVAFEVAELATFLRYAAAELPDDPRRLILALAASGWRLGDLATLCWRDVDTGYAVGDRRAVRMEVRRENEKTRKHKVCFVAGPLADELRSLRHGPIKPMPGNLVFAQAGGSSWADPRRINRFIRRVIDNRMIPGTDAPAWKLYGDSSRLPFRAHSIRHSVNSALLSAGYAPGLVAKVLGHEIRDTQYGTYYHPSDADLLGMADGLARMLFHGAQGGEQMREAK